MTMVNEKAMKFLVDHKATVERNLCKNKQGELLELRDSSSNHNVTGNGKREGLKIDEYVEISSQASEESDEGSETRTYVPERNMESHECLAPAMGEDIVRPCIESARTRG